MVSIKEIMEHIPHRYPFLLVDRVVELEKGQRIVCIKNVTINEPFFQGHFPGEPIMPGVLIVEAMAQSSGILHFLSTDGTEVKSAEIRFLGIDKCRFRRPVIPGDQLRFEITKISNKRNIWKFSGKALVDGQLAAETEMLVSC
ncbi:MAG: 3-hydroxyacyl-ACP dehydratase FabZ [Deltaproteobacteria bacterium]|nr:3-hydroxyacyl-ACP dehydratase FabZ [Deltaproteobacteria bacterium]